MLFCGRSDELGQITSRWKLASVVDNPAPQLVILKAERGVGKTRLALEFYKWLSEQVDTAGSDGYWPDGVKVLDRSWEVNPDPRDCNYQKAIPYLWWGLRLTDPGAENAVTGDAVASYDRFIAPHLVSLSVRAKMLSTGKAIFDVWKDVAKGQIADWTGYGTVMSVGEGLFNTVRILLDRLPAQNSEQVGDQLDKRTVNRVDAILEDLETVLNPGALTYAKTPAVIFLDDAQFSKGDPGFTVFVERLLQMAMTQSWPVMVLVTHWKRDLSQGFTTDRRSFAGILDHGLNGHYYEKGPAAGVPGGFLNTDNTLEIDLQPVNDLSLALEDAFPGLLPDQSRALLTHAGGNPRHLEQIIAFLRENANFFESFDLAKPLTEEGIEEALSETYDIFKVVRRRLNDAPEEVQEAICLASTQGMSFVTGIVEDILREATGKTAPHAIDRAADPFSMVSKKQASQAAEFTERLFYSVASKHRKSLRSLADDTKLSLALREALIRRFDDNEFHKTADVDTKILTYSLAVNAFKNAQGDDAHRPVAALALLASIEKARYSHHAAVAAANEVAAKIRNSPPLIEKIPNDSLNDCADLLIEAGRADEADVILDPLVSFLRHRLDSESSVEKRRDLSRSLHRLGKSASTAGNLAVASQVLRERLSLAREIEEDLKSPEARKELSEALVHLGHIVKDMGEHSAAQAIFEEALSIARELAESLKTPESQTDLSRSLHYLADLARVQGKHSEAADLFAEMLALSRELASCSQTPETQRYLAIALYHVAEMAALRGDHARATTLFNETLSLNRDLAARLQTPGSQMDFGVSLASVARMAKIRGDYETATTLFNEYLNLCRDLAGRLKTPESQHHLSAAVHFIAEMARLRGDYETARTLFAENLELCRDLAARLQTPDSLQNLSVAVYFVADSAREQGNISQATELLEENLCLCRDLDDRLQTPDSRHKLSVAIFHVADLAKDRGDLPRATALFEENLRIARELADRWRTPQYLRAVSLALSRVAELAKERGEVEAAMEMCTENVLICRDLATRLQTPESLRDLGLALVRIGTMAKERGDLAQATAVFERKTLLYAGTSLHA
jgi:tetratricopeptide (TPR) repeat protein